MDYFNLDYTFPNTNVIQFYEDSLVNQSIHRILYRHNSIHLAEIKYIQKWYRNQIDIRHTNTIRELVHTFLKDCICNAHTNITNNIHIDIGESLDDPIDNIPTRVHICESSLDDPIDNIPTRVHICESSLDDPIGNIPTQIKEDTSSSMFSYISNMLYGIKRRVIG